MRAAKVRHLLSRPGRPSGKPYPKCHQHDSVTEPVMHNVDLTPVAVVSPASKQAAGPRFPEFTSCAGTPHRRDGWLMVR